MASRPVTKGARVVVAELLHLNDVRRCLGDGDAEAGTVEEGSRDARVPWTSVVLWATNARARRLDAVLEPHHRKLFEGAVGGESVPMQLKQRGWDPRRQPPGDEFLTKETT
jgi:hypothetical protein